MTTRAMLAAAVLLAALPGALAAQRTASAATLPPTRTAAKDTVGPAADRTSPRPAESVGVRSGTLTIDRESFGYVADGRRDPFLSLMASGELRPLISDLRLTTVIYDPAGQSVAMLRDVNTNEQHRIRVGQQLGRMRVAAIHPKQVVFTIEEFGFSRQETLGLGDSTIPRTQQ